MADEEEYFTHQERMAKIGESEHEKFAREVYNQAGKHLMALEKAASEIGKTDKPVRKDRGGVSPLGGLMK